MLLGDTIYDSRGTLEHQFVLARPTETIQGDVTTYNSSEIVDTESSNEVEFPDSLIDDGES